MGDPLQDSFQKGFQDFLSSTKQLDGILSKAQQVESNPQTREALGQFLEIFRSVQGDLERELPGGVEEMIGDLRQGQRDMTAHMAKAGDLVVKLEDIEARASQAIENGKARLAEAARVPKPPSPADLARQRLAAMARRHGLKTRRPTPPCCRMAPCCKASYWVSSNPNPMFEPPGPKQSATSGRTGQRFNPMPRNQMTLNRKPQFTSIPVHPKERSWPYPRQRRQRRPTRAIGRNWPGSFWTRPTPAP